MKYPPKYPMYIVSKGRADSMFTSKSLNFMGLDHTIAIEPQDFDAYTKAIKDFKLTHAKLLVLPFSNHGDGPGRARNYVWNHSMVDGHERHWVFDDNISYFWRLHNNKLYICNTGNLFRACEDFVDRYENVPLAGLQYKWFLAAREKNPPVIFNTRIYSALLIENSCKHKWRGRYNEDTDLSLRVLKDGDCTVEFTFFSQGKMGTQRLKGGNTAEFYNKEKVKETEAPKDIFYNPDGTINKSQMLVNMHPDVCSIVWKYNRWHHWCDYSPFRNNKLRLKPGIEVPQGTNNYGLKLISGWQKTELEDFSIKK